MSGLGNSINNAMVLAAAGQQRLSMGFSRVRSSIVNTFQNAPALISNAFKSIPGTLTTLSQQSYVTMSSLGASIGNTFREIPIRLSQALSSIPSRVTGVAGRASDAFLSMSTRISSRFIDLKTASTNIWSGFTRGVTGAIQNANKVGPALKRLSFSMLETIGSGSRRAWVAFKEGGLSAVKSVRDSVGSMWRQVQSTAAGIGSSFTKGTVQMGSGSTGIGEAKKAATLAQAKQSALTTQYNMLLQQEALLTTQLAEVDAARNSNRSAGTIAALEGEANVTKEKIAQIEATMGQIEKEKTLANVRKQAFANTGIQAPTAMGKIGAAFSKIGAAAGAGLMTAMLLGPGMLSDLDNRMKDQKDSLNKILKENYSVNIDEVLDKGTFDELQAATNATAKEVEKADKELANTNTSNLAVLGNTLFGWVPGVEEKAKNAKTKSATTQNTANDVNKKMLDIMQGTVKVREWAGRNRGVGNNKNWMDALSFEDQQRKLNDQIVKMGGSIKSGKDRVKAFQALQDEFMNIHLANPDMGYDEISEAVGGADAEEALGEISDTSKKFEEAFSAMFNSEKILEDARALTDNLRTALKTPAQVASDVQKDIDDALKKNADASAKAYNEGIESQVENIEKQKKFLNEVASDAKKKTKSDTKKEKIDDANDAQIAALDEQKDALQDTKKSAEDYASERQMSIEEFITGLKKAKTESDTFNGTLAIMSGMGLKDDVVAQFREMGEDAVPLLAQFRQGSEEEMRKFVENFNSSMGELGKKPVPTMEELTKKYAEAAAAQRKFTANLFQISQIAGAQGRPINADQIEALVTTLGPDSQVLIQNFLDGFNGAVDNPALQQQMSDEFFGLTTDVFDASNVYTDGFSESMKTAMNAATLVVSDSAANLLKLVSDTGNQAAEDALRTAAEVEASIGTSTKFQKAYYDFITKKNQGNGGSASPYVAGGNVDSIQGQANNDSRRGIMEGKDKQGQTAQGEAESVKKKKAADEYNAYPQSKPDQQFAWQSYAAPGATTDEPYLKKALEGRASVAELKELAKYAKTNGRQQKLTKYAQGDIVNKPTLGVFGEDGPEVILPLSKRGRMIELLKKALGKTGGVPEFAKGAIFDAQKAMNQTRGLMDAYSKQGAGVESSAGRARSEMSTPVARPASYDMINASASGPSGGNIVVVPVPVESRTEYQFNGPIQGLTLEQVQADAQRKKRQAALV